MSQYIYSHKHGAVVSTYVYSSTGNRNRYYNYPRKSRQFKMDATFTGLKAETLKAADKLIRYKNHVAFIYAYIKANKLPRGFKLKFHSNTDLDVSNILYKCSTKIMKRTMIYYQKEAKRTHGHLS